MNAAPTSVQNEVEDETVPRSPRHRRRRRRTVVAVVVVGAGIALVVVNPFHKSAKKDTTSAAATSLATVTQGSMAARTSVSGTLTYAGNYTVLNQTGGTFTKVPHVGDTYRQGDVLYQVNGKPIVLLKGSSMPLYRNLKSGMTGQDVRQLNSALVDLGYAGYGLSPKSTYFGWATANALQKLQKHIGVKQTGELAKGQAVFMAAGKVRITSVKTMAGAPAAAGTEVLRASSVDRLVTIRVDAASQSPVKEGDKVTITLPNMKTTPGVVETVGTVAKKKSNGGAALDVRIKPTDPKATGDLDQAPVQVSIVTDSVQNALSVPVTALLALLGGGYGVEVVDPGGAHHLVPVTLGLFDNLAGTVQISGKGLAPGQRVVVPAS